MKVLVISDTHGNIGPVQALINQQAFDVCLHLGDHSEDINKLVFKTAVKRIAVAGNTDFGGIEEEIIELCNNRILLCHGHRYGVKGHYERLLHHARKTDVQIALFGHTHRAFELRRDGVWLLNPGSAGFPHDDEPASALILICENDTVKHQWVTL